jgi:hypothetical protein
MRLRAPAATALLLVSAASGCSGGPYPESVEESIAKEAKRDYQVRVDVVCPEDTAAREKDGDRFTCTATGPSGTTATVGVTVTDQGDGWNWSGEDVADALPSEDYGGSGLPSKLIPDPGSVPGEPCIVLGSGNKLCGTDAKDYCFAQDWSQLDTESVAVCNDVTNRVGG